MVRAREVAKEHPVISSLAAVVAGLSIMTAAVQSVVDVDALIMTEAEHQADLVPLQSAVERNSAWQRCDRWERRIEELKNRILMIQALQMGDSDRQRLIADAEADLEVEMTRFNSNNCAVVLVQ